MLVPNVTCSTLQRFELGGDTYVDPSGFGLSFDGKVGLGRIIALYYRLSTSYQIR
jgi:hypothetical protein